MLCRFVRDVRNSILCVAILLSVGSFADRAAVRTAIHNLLYGEVAGVNAIEVRPRDSTSCYDITKHIGLDKAVFLDRRSRLAGSASALIEDT